MKAGKQVQQVKKQLTIHKYMHMQFLRIGLAVSGVVGVLAIDSVFMKEFCWQKKIQGLIWHRKTKLLLS